MRECFVLFHQRRDELWWIFLVDKKNKGMNEWRKQKESGGGWLQVMFVNDDKKKP